MNLITEPGAYPDITEADYNADPCAEISLRASTAWLIAERGGVPYRAWYETPRLNKNFKPKRHSKFDRGRAAHAVMFRKGSEIKIVEADSYRSKDAQAARDAAYENDQIPLLPHEHETVMLMVESATDQLTAMVRAGTIPAMPFGDESHREHTIIWKEKDIWCRARIDGLPKDGEYLYDYKSTEASAHPDLWQFRQMRQLGFDFSMAHYRRGLTALNITHSPQCAFIVQENYEPYLLSLIRIDDELVMRADQKVQQAMRIWGKCLRDNNWPAYAVGGYDVEMTERERAEMDAAHAVNGASGSHVTSEDVAATVNKPSQLFRK